MTFFFILHPSGLSSPSTNFVYGPVHESTSLDQPPKFLGMNGYTPPGGADRFSGHVHLAAKSQVRTSAILPTTGVFEYAPRKPSQLPLPTGKIAMGDAEHLALYSLGTIEEWTSAKQNGCAPSHTARSVGVLHAQGKTAFAEPPERSAQSGGSPPVAAARRGSRALTRTARNKKSICLFLRGILRHAWNWNLSSQSSSARLLN
jgi:hypothetical protein